MDCLKAANNDDDKALEYLYISFWQRDRQVPHDALYG